MDNGYTDKLTIDRIDNSKGYTPENCRWATYLQQSDNSSHTRKIEYAGMKKSFTEWARLLGVGRNTLRMRYDVLGWSLQKTFNTINKCQ